jgi:hypothetical protein
MHTPMNTDSSAHTDSSVHQADSSKHRMAKPVLFAIFSGIWFSGLLLVVRADSQVPTYMSIVATVFFFMLVPSMVELVQDFDRFVARFGDRFG